MSTGNSPRGPPQPPAKGRPAPPRKGPPSPPKTKNSDQHDLPTAMKTSSDESNSILEKAKSLELIGEFSQAAIFYRSAGYIEDENRCLQLALGKSEASRVTNIHNGDKIIRDSVIMDNED